MKKAQGMPYAWIFALIIGGAILFLAIFFSGKLFQTASYQTEAELARSLDILLNPLSAAGAASISMPIKLPEKAEVNFSCDEKLDTETIYLRVARGKEPFSYPIRNKYIFADDFNSKDMQVFSKPFEVGWKVDDLIYLISKDYCFINPPENIRKEMSSLNSSFISVFSSKENCKEKAVTVCFSGACDIAVNYGEGTIKIKTSILRFINDTTMYGAIFGPRQYNCNLERLMKRLDFQTDIFMQMSDIISGKGCSRAAALKQELIGLKAAISNKDYSQIKGYGERIDSRNKMSSCPLY